MFKIRAIDFDQQSYEGSFKLYKPFLVQRKLFVYRKLVQDKLNQNAIEQYQNEERSVLVKRLSDSETRVNDLMLAMKSTQLAPKNTRARLERRSLSIFIRHRIQKSKFNGRSGRSSIKIL